APRGSLMWNRTLMSIGILGAAWTAALRAQDFDYSRLNLNFGGGVSTPLNPTGQYAGVNGNFVFGAGYNFDAHNSILGEFLWNGLPPNRFALHPINAPSGSSNLYSGTANYRFQLASLGGSPIGVYLIGGGGWYYRQTKISKE